MVVHQAPLPMGFPRQENWSGLPFPSPGDLPHPGNEPASLGSPALSGRFFTTTLPGKPPIKTYCSQINKYIVFKQKYISLSTRERLWILFIFSPYFPEFLNFSENKCCFDDQEKFQHSLENSLLAWFAYVWGSHCECVRFLCAFDLNRA